MELPSNAKQLKDFKDYYITSNGDIYSYKNKYKCRKGLRKLIPWEHNGYLYIQLVDGEHKKRCLMHRLVAEYFVDGYFEGAVVNHKDSNTFNNDYTNLEWVTQKENVHHGINKTERKDATKWYCKWIIRYPDGKLSPELCGRKDFEKYIKENNLDVSISSLWVHRKSRGFELIKLDGEFKI